MLSMALSPSHSPEARGLDFGAAKLVQTFASNAVASFFVGMAGEWVRTCGCEGG